MAHIKPKGTKVMAQAQAIKAAPAAAPISKAAVERKKRGEGLFLVSFLDAEGKVHSRAPANVSGVRVDAKAHGHFDVPLAEMNDDTKNQMVAIGLKQRLQTYVANHVEDDASQATKFAQTVWAEIRQGKIYTRAGEGGGKGKKVFDSVLHADAMRAARKEMAERQVRARRKDGTAGALIKAMTEGEYQDLIVSLNTADRAARTKRVADWMTSKYFERNFRALQARRVKIEDEQVVDELV
jgi:hypothetical protein